MTLLAIAGALALALAPSVASAADATGPECIDASESAINLRREHRLREARTQLSVCASASCPVEIRAECTKKMEQVNASIPSIVFDAKDVSGNDLANVHVVIDGKPLQEKIAGIAISLDPGEHVFVFEAPGLPTVQRSFVLREGEKERRERIVIAAAAAPKTAPQAQRAEDAAPASGSSWNGRKTAAVVVGSAGLVALGVGSAFGLSAGASWAKSRTACPSAANCPQYAQAVTHRDSASSAATVSTVLFAVGGAAIVSAVVLWLTAPSGAAEGPPAQAARTTFAPMAGPGLGGGVLQGSF